MTNLDFMSSQEQIDFRGPTVLESDDMWLEAAMIAGVSMSYLKRLSQAAFGDNAEVYFTLNDTREEGVGEGIADMFPADKNDHRRLQFYQKPPDDPTWHFYNGQDRSILQLPPVSNERLS